MRAPLRRNAAAFASRPVRTLLAAALLSACAPTSPHAVPVWTRSGANAGDLEGDRAACLAEAEARADAEKSEGGQVAAGGNTFLRCMRERGWTQTAADQAE